MTPAEMERTIHFILEQQAQSTANMQKLEENVDKLAAKHLALEDVVMKLAHSHIELVNSHKELANSHKELADSHRRLAAAQTETEERLNAFITFVEKYISSRNGG